MKKDYDKEIKYLNIVLDEISKQHSELLDDAQVLQRRLNETQKEMWEEVSAVPNDLTQLDELIQAKTYLDEIKLQNIMYKNNQQKTKRLQLMQHSPYFARIDFTEKGEEDSKPEKIYIGIGSLITEKGDFFVYDWRAPISGMFYDHEIGQAGYDCPDGYIEGYISLKRQFRIVNGKLDFMFDSSVAIEDEILQEILGRSASAQMKNIVATIQREQNKIIRDNTHNYLLVSGPAGSGKTTVALHRVAWLLYKMRDVLTPKNILVISPNDLFNDYISNVLPSLGEENMRQMTYRQVIERMTGNDYKVGDFIEQLEFIFTETDQYLLEARKAGILFKGSETFRLIMKEYISQLEIMPFEFADLTINGKIIASADELKNLYRYDYDYMTIKKRIEKLKLVLNKKVKNIMSQRVLKYEAEMLNNGQILDRREIRRVAVQRVRNEYLGVEDYINQALVYDSKDLYYQLFNDEELSSRLAKSAGVTLPDNWEQICDFTVSQLELGFLPYEDTAPLLLLMTLAGDTKNTKEIKHVVIDECQDYTPIQLEALRKFFSSAGMTILGDTGQSINPHAPINDFEEFKKGFDDEKIGWVVLSKSYRSTLQITSFASRLIGLPHDYENVNRSGELPEVIKVVNRTKIINNVEVSSILMDIVEKLNTLDQEGLESAAIICTTAEEAFNTYRKLKKFTPIRLITSENDMFTTGPCVIPVYLAKGLEFDAVFILNANKTRFPSPNYDKLLYTACTRAMHKLTLYYMGEINESLKRIPEDFYTRRDI